MAITARRSLRISSSDFPENMPGIWDTLRITLGWAWTYLIVAELVAAVANPEVDLCALEKEKIKGAVRTDFILSAEIIVIALGTVADAPLPTRVAVLVGIAVLMTVGVYGLVAGIVKLDDAGLWLNRQAGALQRKIGAALLVAAPALMKFLAIAGTAYAAYYRINRLLQLDAPQPALTLFERYGLKIGRMERFLSAEGAAPDASAAAEEEETHETEGSEETEETERDAGADAALPPEKVTVSAPCTPPPTAPSSRRPRSRGWCAASRWRCSRTCCWSSR